MMGTADIASYTSRLTPTGMGRGSLQKPSFILYTDPMREMIR
jgi:hypothetical protein